MMTPEIEVPSTKRSSTYTGKFGAKAADTPNTACTARHKSRQNLRPYLRGGGREKRIEMRRGQRREEEEEEEEQERQRVVAQKGDER